MHYSYHRNVHVRLRGLFYTKANRDAPFFLFHHSRIRRAWQEPMGRRLLNTIQQKGVSRLQVMVDAGKSRARYWSDETIII